MPHLTASHVMLTASPPQMHALTGSLVNDSLSACSLSCFFSPACQEPILQRQLLLGAPARPCGSGSSCGRLARGEGASCHGFLALTLFLSLPLLRWQVLFWFGGPSLANTQGITKAQGTTEAPLHACKRAPGPAAPVHAPSTDKLTALGFSSAPCLLLQPLPPCCLPCHFLAPPPAAVSAVPPWSLSPKFRHSASSLFKVQQQGEEARRSIKGQQGTAARGSNAPSTLRTKISPLPLVSYPLLFSFSSSSCSLRCHPPIRPPPGSHANHPSTETSLLACCSKPLLECKAQQEGPRAWHRRKAHEHGTGGRPTSMAQEEGPRAWHRRKAHEHGTGGRRRTKA
ncbi:unnamed protein product [Closterium sp. NIES-64]|nr:unnamed protein product [Closterium sp. NIES-64]CAI5978848.1 unnamed protein product [Closterium sp. NIES-64]